ncbi:DUF819 family protein [Parahaliea sp. F7430]|uniref:DUF819 family protein n=1 Tax=Sediminihaliea albiluteola TaxID=2758564 RepID=A0A7W2YKR0_9GAMM|nr:DUF819 family protein [Sediminihaliea albiluteola]MBA6413989.1 DUF819 family protein [Sediminihaliea albiluteola]
MMVDLSVIFPRQTVTSVQSSISELSIAIALPLLLFSINVKAALNMAGDTLKGMALALLSVVIVSTLGAVLFSGQLDNIWQIAGMSVGAYTGGGPNMAAIKTAIDGDHSVFLTMATYDLIFSAMYLIFVMTIAQKLFALFLKPYKAKNQSQELDYAGMEHMADESALAYKKLIEPKQLSQTALGLICSLLVVAVSVLVASLLPGSLISVMTIILITTMGLAASFIPRLRALSNSFQLGMYFILVFCFTTGTMIDTTILSNIDMSLAAYISFILVGSLCLQAVLCKFAKIDTDTFLITSSAAIMSVPFVPVIAGALKNREILLPGFAAAILGYAVGNYLGIVVANITRWLVSVM